MRKTPQFTQEQLLFIATLVGASCYDRLTTLEWEDPIKQDEYEAGAIDACGLVLASLYAQITRDGMAIADAVDLAQLPDKSTNKDCKAAARNFLLSFEK
jgi:hypothetical protein